MVQNWILKILVMTIFDLNIWFMVTTNPLSKCSVNVNYAPDRAYFNRKCIILRAFFFNVTQNDLDP